MSPTTAETAQNPIVEWLTGHLAATTGEAVKRIDTQGAIVLLSGHEAWKLRRAIRLPFLDYSTLERRRAAAEAEIRLNIEAAPGVYRDAAPIVAAGRDFTIGGEGPAVEWITRMRRFDEDATFDRLAERGELTRAAIEKLGRAILRSHERAERRDAGMALDSLSTWIEQNREAFAGHPDLFAPESVSRLDAFSRTALAEVGPLLTARGASGFCRRGHGDLHLRNIAMIDGEPAPFDAIEFDDAIATGDVLYDLAFALMDLYERGFHEAANDLMNAYLGRGPEAHYAGLAALPLFMSLRAAIRAKVEAANRDHLAGEARAGADSAARRYFDCALELLEPRTASLVAVGGLSGSGKSALARALAPELGRPPGAVRLASDIERKHLFGLEAEAKLPDAAYGRDTTALVYERVRRRAALALRAGQSAIVDMTHATHDARAKSAAIAEEARVAFSGFWLDAGADIRAARVEARKGDASDADARIARAQKADALSEPGWSPLDASATPDHVLAQARVNLADARSSAIAQPKGADSGGRDA